jgi:hypothetical protein
LKQEEHGGGRPGLRSARNRVQGGSLAWSLREATEQLRHAVQVEVQASFEHPRPDLQRQIPQAIAGEPLGDQTIAVGPDGAVVVGHRIVARCGLVATVWTPQPVNDSGLRSIRATETSSARYATCRARPASGRRGGIAIARQEGANDHAAEQGGHSHVGLLGQRRDRLLCISGEDAVISRGDKGLGFDTTCANVGWRWSSHAPRCIVEQCWYVSGGVLPPNVQGGTPHEAEDHASSLVHRTASSARLRASTLTRGSPKKPSCRPSVD